MYVERSDGVKEKKTKKSCKYKKGKPPEWRSWVGEMGYGRFGLGRRHREFAHISNDGRLHKN